MNYLLNVYPSSAEELAAVKSIRCRQIKPITEMKLQAAYKKRFDAAVKKHNERAISGRLIDNYYTSIKESNVPEVYKLSVMVYYDTMDKAQASSVQRILGEFKKALEKTDYIQIVSAFSVLYDEIKELLIFFIPVCDNYVQGLSIRNDLIDLTRKLTDTKENLSILAAMPLFVNHIDAMFSSVNRGEIMSQKQMEEAAYKRPENNPEFLHAVAIESLRKSMQSLSSAVALNKKLTNDVEKEKQRIAHDLVWSKDKEKEIIAAEDRRIQAEKEAEAARIQAEHARRLEESRIREEQKLRDEERELESRRLAEQAKRSLELMRQLDEKKRSDEAREASRTKINQEYFAVMLENHKNWQNIYNVEKAEKEEQLTAPAVGDSRRLIIKGADLTGVHFAEAGPVKFVKFIDCTFTDCTLMAWVENSNIQDCRFSHSQVGGTWKNCSLESTDFKTSTVKSMTLLGCRLLSCDFGEATLDGLFSAENTYFAKTSFQKTEFNKCDMKQNAFIGCNFSESSFEGSDMRDSFFQSCNTSRMNKGKSLFRGAKFNT